MMKVLSLSLSIYFDALYTALARAIGHMGFPARELADRVRPLTDQYGVLKLSQALGASQRSRAASRSMREALSL